jgi:hypothetical protein
MVKDTAPSSFSILAQAQRPAALPHGWPKAGHHAVRGDRPVSC